MKKYVLCLLAALLLLTGCGLGEKAPEAAGDGYRQISQEEALEMMALDDGHVVVDVRTEAEYEEAHIPGAINVPNESIDGTLPEALPDPEQILLVYCRSGRRSKEAAGKLAALGYTNVFEFGGILDWTGETVPGSEPEGGWTMESMATLVVEIGDKSYVVHTEDNSSAEALLEKLESEPLELEMRDYGGFEKVGELPWTLPTNDEQITTAPGDVILYQGRELTIYYGENTWSLTRLGCILVDDPDELREALGEDGVTVRFWLEWTE